MSEAIRLNMAAYAKAKEASRRREESAIEEIRWHFTRSILKDYPAAEFVWITPEGPPSLQVQVRLGDYGWVYNFGKLIFEAPGHEMNVAVTTMLQYMSLDPLRAMFDT